MTVPRTTVVFPTIVRTISLSLLSESQTYSHSPNKSATPGSERSKNWLGDPNWTAGALVVAGWRADIRFLVALRQSVIPARTASTTVTGALMKTRGAMARAGHSKSSP